MRQQKDIREKSNRTSESRSKSVKKRRFNNYERASYDRGPANHSPDIVNDASKQNTLMLLKMDRRSLKKGSQFDKKSAQPTAKQHPDDHSRIESH